MKTSGILIIMLLVSNIAMSQTSNLELISSAGGSFSNSSYKLDWSAGECVTATDRSGTYILTQGFHQSTYSITPVEDLIKNININIFPNPTSSLITVNFLSYERLGDIQIIITDIYGKTLQQAEMQSKQKQLNISDYANGVYFLTIKQKNQLLKSFKIIKN